MNKRCQACADKLDDMPAFEEGLTENKGFKRVIGSLRCKETLVFADPWWAPRAITRAWCLYEMTLTISANKNVSMLWTPDADAELLAQLEQPDGLARLLFAISSIESKEAYDRGER